MSRIIKAGPRLPGPVSYADLMTQTYWVTIGDPVVVGDTYHIHINGTDHGHLATGGQTPTDVATALKVLINAGAQAGVCTATSTAGVLTVVNDIPTQLLVTSSVTGGGGGTISQRSRGWRDSGPVLLDTGDVVIRDSRAEGNIWVPSYLIDWTHVLSVHKNTYESGNPPSGVTEVGSVTGGSGSPVSVKAVAPSTSALEFAFGTIGAAEFAVVVIRCKPVSVETGSDSNYPALRFLDSGRNEYVDALLDMGSANVARWYTGATGRAKDPYSTTETHVLNWHHSDAAGCYSTWRLLTDVDRQAEDSADDVLFGGTAAADKFSAVARAIIASGGEDTEIEIEHCALYVGTRG